jgi:two-component system, NtrC family, nitrogen regulation sensor histidine kinase NtrY
VRLAPRLVFAFGFLAAAAALGLGVSLREERRNEATATFDQQVQAACIAVARAISDEGDRDRRLIGNACQDGELAGSLLPVLERGDLDANRLRFVKRVPRLRVAYGLDELRLATPKEILATDPIDRFSEPWPLAQRIGHGEKLDTDAEYSVGFVTKEQGKIAIQSQCSVGSRDKTVFLRGVRYLEPTVRRLEESLGMRVQVAQEATIEARPFGGATSETLAASSSSTAGAAERPSLSENVQNAYGAAQNMPQTRANEAEVPKLRAALGLRAARCHARLSIPGRALRMSAAANVLEVDVQKSTADLDASIARLDRFVIVAVLLSMLIAFAVGVLLARGLSAPLVRLAEEAERVPQAEAKPIASRGGSTEVRNLVLVFNRMLADLASARRRLADVSRVAAWREVARRVAHEVKNPLAPIQAAIETLRRLRARNDPAFDEYFDEASSTVLQEVRRISDIVTEFTRFARLPHPVPTMIDIRAVLDEVAKFHRDLAPQVAVDVTVSGSVPQVRADRGQLVQVATNLVQNALDALKEQAQGGRVHIAIASRSAANGAVWVDVRFSDTGPGVDPEFAPRIFEPYATTKAKGTGLGLAIAQRIAVEHAGELVLEEVPALGRGTTFRLSLPVLGPPDVLPGSERM